MFSNTNRFTVNAITEIIITEITFSLHNRNNRYTRGGDAIPVASNSRVYGTVKNLIVGEANVIEETGWFPDSSVKTKNTLTWFKKKRRMMMMMMMNCFCGLVDRRKAFSLTSSWDDCQISSPSRISDTPRAGFGPAQNLGSGFVE